MRLFPLLLAAFTFWSVPGYAESEGQLPFDQWLEAVRVEAIERGISEETLDSAFLNLQPNDRVIELDRKQPEFTQTFEQYIAARVSDTRIKRGREMMARYRDELRAVADYYGVQPRFIAAIWGMETNYGGYTGGMSVIQSLATLAWDPRRSGFFRSQLFAALEIIDEGHITAENMLGSWAGAMGQSQFMPASFKAYAQDFNGDDRRDIWTTEIDVFASIAHYLASHGWRGDRTWGRAVSIPDGMAPDNPELAQQETPRSCARALRSHSRNLSLAEWQDRGVRRLDGSALPEVDAMASMVQPGGAQGQTYLTYSNYRAILSYNCSNLYAMAVGHLADELRTAE